ncbi:hypothetical protein D3C86_1840870 [compost metagenome]
MKRRKLCTGPLAMPSIIRWPWSLRSSMRPLTFWSTTPGTPRTAARLARNVRLPRSNITLPWMSVKSGQAVPPFVLPWPLPFTPPFTPPVTLGPVSCGATW